MNMFISLFKYEYDALYAHSKPKFQNKKTWERTQAPVFTKKISVEYIAFASPIPGTCHTQLSSCNRENGVSGEPVVVQATKEACIWVFSQHHSSGDSQRKWRHDCCHIYSTKGSSCDHTPLSWQRGGLEYMLQVDEKALTRSQCQYDCLRLSWLWGELR